MSHTHTLYEAIDEIPEAGIGGQQYPPLPAPAQAPHGVSNFVDGSGPIFSMYLEMATEEDKKMAENWKADADGILIFTGLFSAAVASLISVSIQDIRPNSQDTSNFYLANIYQVIADPNRPNISLPSSPPPFSPPNYAVWVNALWFLSLVISLTCALLATFLQQWARRYLKVTQSRYTPHKRARIRAFLAEGVDRLLLPWTVEVLPTLLHISLFLFFVGLVVFLWNINLTIFKLVLSWVGVCTALYGCITIMPIFRHDSPYLTPLSLPVWHIVTGIPFLTFRALQSLTLLDCFSWRTYLRFRDLAERYGQLLVQGMQKAIEETALNSSSEIDARAFLWTFDCLDEDHELERFFSGLPGFCSSKVVEDPFPTLAEEGKQRLFTALIGMLDRTFSSDLLPAVAKRRRAMIAAKAIDPAHIPEASSAIDRIWRNYEFGGPLVTGIVQMVRCWGNNVDEGGILDAQVTISNILVKIQPRGDSWLILASHSLGVPEAVLRDYAARGDSLSLAILIHVTRQQFSHYRKRTWPSYKFSVVLKKASIFNVQDTSPELQHKLCALWNQIVRKVRNDNDQSMAFHILGRIRNVYLALHQGTDSSPTRFSASTVDWDSVLWEPSSYPVCKVPDHHPDSTPHIHDDTASTTGVRAVPHVHDHTAHVSPFPASGVDLPSPSAHSLLRVDESFTDVQPLDNNISVSVFLQPVDQTSTGARRIPAASPDPIDTHAIHRGIDASARTMHLFIQPSASSPLKSKATTSPPDSVIAEHTPVSRTPSLDIPSSPFRTPVPDDILPTESHSLMLAPGTPGSPRPWLSSAPHLGAAAEGEGSSTKTALRKDQTALRPSSTIRGNIIAVPDLRPPSPSLVTGVAIAGPSGHTGDHPLQPSHG